MSPGVSPVWCASAGYGEFFWVSDPDSRHPTNIATWPASIAHAVHSAAWNVLGALTLITVAPVVVNVYLVGDLGLLILIGAAIGAIWFGRRYKSGMDAAQSGEEVPRVAPGQT